MNDNHDPMQEAARRIEEQRRQDEQRRQEEEARRQDNQRRDDAARQWADEMRRESDKERAERHAIEDRTREARNQSDQRDAKEGRWTPEEAKQMIDARNEDAWNRRQAETLARKGVHEAAQYHPEHKERAVQRAQEEHQERTGSQERAGRDNGHER